MWSVACLVVTGLLVSADYPPFAVPRLEGVTRPSLPPVTGRIHVDQFGYLPAAAKVAVISDPQRGYNAADSYSPGQELQIRSRNGEVVFRGEPLPWRDGEIHEDSGDQGWWLDFSSLEQPGEFYVFDPSTGLRSPIFRIGPDVYREVLRAAVRTYFYQRLSWEIRPPYAEEPWVLPSYMDQDRRARYVGAKDDPTTERDLSGGWMDAGDTNKYPPFNSDALISLMYAYRANPGIFTDDFGIPESGNGLPDLLDELKYQLDWLVKMQEPDGGVYVKMGDIDYSGDPDRPRYYGPKCTGATIASTMIFGLASRIYGEFEPWREFARDLRLRAERGWQYYQSNPRTYESDTGEIKSGNASRGPEDQDRMEAMAAIHLFALTGSREYHDVILEKAPRTRQLMEDIWSPYQSGMAEAMIDYLSLPNADPEFKERIRAQLRRSAVSSAFAPSVEADLYRSWMNPEAYHWGSNNPRASFGFNALLVRDHGGVAEHDRDRLTQRARDLLHYFHGKNPMSVVMLTNMERLGAELSVKRIWHERFNFDTRFAANPPPGYVVGGPNQNFGGENGDRPGDVSWIRRQPRGKAYADFNEPWPMNSWEITENAIYYQAAYIRLLAGVMPAPR